ncbi:MAG: putative transposase YbfD/YdcC, partial [Halioglobus sp.]
SSLAAEPKVLGRSIRSHWGIENSVHWILDVAFREDAQKAKAGIKIKRQKAGWDNNYLLSVLGVKFSS